MLTTVQLAGSPNSSSLAVTRAKPAWVTCTPVTRSAVPPPTDQPTLVATVPLGQLWSTSCEGELRVGEAMVVARIGTPRSQPATQLSAHVPQNPAPSVRPPTK